MDYKEKRNALVNYLINSGYLKTKRIIEAFMNVPRELFVPPEYRRYAYADEPLPIGRSQTISAPHMVAIMTELLKPEKKDKILEVGAGSGYQAAILGKLSEKVFTTEVEKELAENARKNLKTAGIKNVKVIYRDGSFGYEEESPYNKIIVTCACRDIPKPLEEQLKEEGRIVIPIGSHWYQELVLGIKKKGKLEKSHHGGCIFVPMKHK